MCLAVGVEFGENAGKDLQKRTQMLLEGKPTHLLFVTFIEYKNPRLQNTPQLGP